MNSKQVEVKIPFNKEVCLLLLRDHYYKIAGNTELLIEYAKMIGTTTLEKALQDVMVSLNEVDVQLEQVRKGGKRE